MNTIQWNNPSKVFRRSFIGISLTRHQTQWHRFKCKLVNRKTDMINRRKHKRYRAKSGTFALLRSTSIELNKIRDMSMGQIGFAVIKSRPIKMGQIINISKNGLAFDYIERQSKTIEVFKLDILFAEDAYFLGKVLFRPIFDYAIDAEIPFKS